MSHISRRLALKFIGLGSTLVGSNVAHADKHKQSEPKWNSLDGWSNLHNRVFLGEQFWANPMEDWRIVDGAAECQTGGGNRNIQLLTHQIEEADGPIEMSVQVSQAAAGNKDGGAGFGLGFNSDVEDYRANAFSRLSLAAGIVEGQLLLAGKRKKAEGLDSPQNIVLHLTGQSKQDNYELTLRALTADGDELGSMTHTVPKKRIRGNVALVSNFDASLKKNQGARYRFQNWAVSGDGFVVRDERKFGPILWSMYTLSDNRSDDGFVLKMTALTGPVGTEGKPTVEFLTAGQNGWKSHGKQSLDTDSWTTTFRVPNWNEKEATEFKLVYREQGKDGKTIEATREGIIRSNPTGRPLRMAALTCQNDYGFPYAPVADNVLKLDPDLTYFSGDQIYESHGGYGLIREPAEPAILNYLRKFYQFGWAFGEVMRSCPVVCIPDDHDVFHGNLWGEGGAPMGEGTTSSSGGYREPARMVNVVHTTCTSHHPDFYDPTPCKQDISTYYGDMVYGDVGFIILADRQWKSAPTRVDTGSGRADHVLDPNFDTSKLDKPGLELLGERQEKFLQEWCDDWRGHKLKVVLSQTVFSGVATHHGGYDGYLKADLDSGAWPQTARDRTIKMMNCCKPLHINGDQHLTTLSQYGVDEQRDSCWSFCTPAISAGYPRWWRPDEVGMEHAHRPKHGNPNTGEYLDGFGNKVYVYAVGNPEVGTARNRYDKAHQKGSGFGFVTIDTEKKTYFIESFRFLVDATKLKPEDQFPGWPVTIHQQENAGDNLIG